uniref:Uncharacterized protein n=1 Tax=Onchocerca volvulus TaxID=6282 RepID=A0A8R1XVZ6_ONCVO
MLRSSNSWTSPISKIAAKSSPTHTSLLISSGRLLLRNVRVCYEGNHYEIDHTALISEDLCARWRNEENAQNHRSYRIIEDAMAFNKRSCAWPSISWPGTWSVGISLLAIVFVQVQRCQWGIGGCIGRYQWRGCIGIWLCYRFRDLL